MTGSGKLYKLLLLLILLLTTACEESTADDESRSADIVGRPEDGAFVSWLQQLDRGEIDTVNMDATLEWGLGYFTYYGELEAIGLDNLIYNALEVHRRLDTGEVTTADLSRNEQNLLAISEGITYEPETALTEQVAQTPEIRAALLERVTESQQELSPAEALDSGAIIGVFAPPAAGAIGGKYLVYVRETVDAEFSFLGVIMAVDTAGHGGQVTYSFQGWENLAWLGDATGPFWDDLPAGVSGDATNSAEGRPGVLLISEDTYEDITAGNAD